MKKVDLSKIEFKRVDDTTDVIDLQHGENGLPNQIYMAAREIKWKDFGHRLYHAEGKVELTDEEYIYLINFIQGWSVVMKEAITAAIK